MIPRDPDPILDFNFDDNANTSSSMTHLSYSHDVSPPHTPFLNQNTYTPQSDVDADAIHTVPSSRPTLHNLRIPTSSHAVPANTSDDRGSYKAFVPMNPQTQNQNTQNRSLKRKPAPPLTEIYARSKSQSEKRQIAAERDPDPGPSPLKLQKQIRNLLALVVLLLLILIAMLIPIIYLTARTWIFASHNASAFAVDGQGTSRGLPGLVSDIVNRAANATKTEIANPVDALGGWTQNMSSWANETSARLAEMDAGGLNKMVKSAVGGVDGVNDRFDNLLKKLVMVEVNGTGET